MVRNMLAVNLATLRYQNMTPQIAHGQIFLTYRGRVQGRVERRACGRSLAAGTGDGC